jgi:O-antigen ligase/Flp pilus assembly protein TadD
VRAQRLLIIGLVFFGVLALLPFTPDPASDIKVLGYELTACALLFLWVFSPTKSLMPTRIPLSLQILLGMYFGLNVVATFLSPNVGYSLLRECVKLASLLILLFAAANVFRSPTHVWRLVGAICIAVSIASLYGILQYAGLDPFPWEDKTGMLRSAPATFGNPNVASHVLVIAVILGLGLCTQRRKRWSILCVALFLGHFALTQTRGSLLALAGATLLVFAVVVIARWVKSASRAVALTLGSVFLFFVLLGVAVGAILAAKTGSPYPDDTPLTLRYNSFYGACRMALDRPILGYGPGMFQVANPEYWTQLEKERVAIVHELNSRVHNEPLEIAVEAGIPAGILFVSILVLLVCRNLYMGLVSTDRERRYLGMTFGALFFAFLLDSLFGFNMHVPASALLFFLMAGASTGVWSEDGDMPRSPERKHSRSFQFGRKVAFGCAVALLLLGIRDFAALLFYQRGLGAMESKAFAAAVPCFARAESLAPYDWRIPFQFGTAYSRMGRSEEAAKKLARAVELHPGDVVAILDTAKAFFNLAGTLQGERAEACLKEAQGYVTRATRLNPISPEVHDLSGRIAMLRAERLAGSDASQVARERGEAWKEAEVHLSRAIECGSENKGEVLRLIAQTRFQREDMLGAQMALVRSLEDNPDDMATWKLFLETSQQSGHYDAILSSLAWNLEVLNRAATTKQSSVPLKIMQARVLYEGYGDRDAADVAFLQLAKAYPERIDTWSAFHAFAKSVENESAFNALFAQEIAGRKGGDESLPPQIQAVALAFGNTEDGIVAAAAKLIEALQAQQSSVTDISELAPSFVWAADVLSARARDVALSPQHSGDLFMRLGGLYAVCQEFAAAAHALEQALPSLSGQQRVICLRQMGVAFAKAGKADMAVKAFEQAVAAAPNDLETQYGLAQALAQAGQRAKARVAYRMILVNFPLDEAGRRSIQREIDALAE